MVDNTTFDVLADARGWLVAGPVEDSDVAEVVDDDETAAQDEDVEDEADDDADEDDEDEDEEDDDEEDEDEDVDDDKAPATE